MDRTTGTALMWSQLGAHDGSGRPGPIVLEYAEIRVVDLELQSPIRTSHGQYHRRPVVLVHLVGSGANGAVEGWGECAALPDTGYDAEDVAASFSVLEQTFLPLLFSAGGVGAPLPSLGDVKDLRAEAPGASLAFAALEMAVADCHLRSVGTSFADFLDVGSQPVPVGAVVGGFGDTHELLVRIDGLVEKGYPRVKIKIGRGFDSDPIAAIRRAHPELILQADANEGYAESDTEDLVGLDRFELACLEQPFIRGDLPAHARLAKRIATPICLDESLTSPETVLSALDMEACSVVCVKPARLGGVGAALEVIEHCAASSIPLWIGGMFESGFARAVNVVVSAVSGTTWAGDLSPARSYLREDLARPVPEGESCGAVVPSRSPGMAPVPDPTVVDRLTVRLVRFGADRGVDLRRG